MARVVVLGGTGFAGAAIVKEAAERGHDVVSVSRSAPSDAPAGVRVVAGSVLEPAVLDQALTGAEVVIETVSPRGDMVGRVEGLVDDLVERAAADGFRLGVIGGASSLLVAEGGPTLLEAHPVPPEILPEVQTGIDLKDRLERAPEGVDWFYVSPAQVFGAWAQVPDTGSYRLGEDVLIRDEDGTSAISAGDLAKAVVDEIEQPRYRRRRFHVAH